MKRLLYLCLPIISIVLLSGCIKEEYDDCERCTLTFSYVGDGVTDIFPEKITDVKLYVFDANNTLIQTKHITQNDLRVFQGTKLNLKKGTYRVVGVGNSFDKTVINAPNNGAISDRSFYHPNADTGANIEGNDALYLGQQTIEMPNGWYEANVPFRSSHLKVTYTVEVKNADWQGTNPSEAVYSLEVKNLTPKTNFDNTPFGNGVSYTPSLTLGGDDKHNAAFNIMRHAKQNSVEFALTRKSTGQEVHSLRLEDFLTEFTQVDVTKQEVLIPIVVELVYEGSICTDVNVNIDIWNKEDITPGFGNN